MERLPWVRGHPARIVKMKAGETRVPTSRKGRNVYNRRCKPADATNGKIGNMMIVGNLCAGGTPALPTGKLLDGFVQ